MEPEFANFRVRIIANGFVVEGSVSDVYSDISEGETFYETIEEVVEHAARFLKGRKQLALRLPRNGKESL